MAKKITIIRDTRENTGWTWEPEQEAHGGIQIINTETTGLDAADYSIKGYEDLVRIERKAGFFELFGNMTPKDNKERFEREMEKLKSVKYKYLLIETSLSEDVFRLSVPQMRYGPPGSAVFKWIIELQMKYGIIPIFSQCGKKTARYIFDTVLSKA